MTAIQHFRRWRSQYFHEAEDLFFLTVARKQRPAGQKLGNDAAEREQVDGGTIRQVQNDLGGAVKAGLDVPHGVLRRDILPRRSKINLNTIVT